MKCYVPWGRNISFLDNLEGVCELLLVRHGEQQYK